MFGTTFASEYDDDGKGGVRDRPLVKPGLHPFPKSITPKSMITNTESRHER